MTSATGCAARFDRLLRRGAAWAGRPPRDVVKLGNRLLAEPAAAVDRGGWSALHGDGTPVEVCLVSTVDGTDVRLVVDPAWRHAEPDRRLAASRRSLAEALEAGGARALAPICDALVASWLPADVHSLRRWTRGAFWLGVGLTSPGVAIYVDAEPLGDSGWDAAADWLGRALPTPEHARHDLDGLVAHTRLASVGVEGVGPGRLRVKLYTRLRRPVALETLGGLLRDPVFGAFLGHVVGARSMSLSGLVLGLGWDGADGRLRDVKLDLCGHCLPRPPHEWSRLLGELADGLGVALPPAGPALADGTAEVAFLGLGLDRAGRHRLNVYLKPPGLGSAGLTAGHLRDRLARAVVHLADLQADEGYWSDYHLPVGPATQWPTAFVGLALAEAADILEGEPARRARAAAGGAAGWLLRRRTYPAGWGYNEATGPDADSTAFAIRLLRALGHGVPEADVAWLLARWSGEGGLSTYPRDDCWGCPHPCVTATGYFALPQDERVRLRESLARGLARWTQPDGTWPAYWWRTHWYSTFHFGRLIRRLGVEARFGERPDLPALEADPPGFDLAWAAGVAAQRGAPGAAGLLARLLDRQRFDGGWCGGWNLRVTDPACAEPWRVPRGELYLDFRGTITTAGAVAVLTEVLSERLERRGGRPPHAVLQEDVPALPVDVAGGGLPLPRGHSPHRH